MYISVYKYIIRTIRWQMYEEIQNHINKFNVCQIGYKYS